MVNCNYKPGYWEQLLDHSKVRCSKPVAIVGKSDYCEKHGCEQCNYARLKNKYSGKYKQEETITDYGEEVCSLDCKIKGESKKVGEETDKKRQKVSAIVQELGQKLITEIKNTFAPFWEKIKTVRIEELKENFLNQKVNDGLFLALTQSTIDAHASLTDSEREQWKAIYQNQNIFLIDNLPKLYPLERKFLISLAEKYKEQEEQARQNNIPECKKCKLRREQPSTWPVGCKEWCKECVEQKQREKQTPDNNNNYQLPINISPL